MTAFTKSQIRSVWEFRTNSRFRIHEFTVHSFIHPGITGIILGESWFMFVLNPSDWNDEKLPPLNPPDEWNFHLPCCISSVQVYISILCLFLSSYPSFMILR